MMGGEQNLQGKEQEVVEPKVEIVEKDGEKYIQVPDDGGKLSHEGGEITKPEEGGKEDDGGKAASGEADPFEGLSREELIKKIQEKDSLVGRLESTLKTAQVQTPEKDEIGEAIKSKRDEIKDLNLKIRRLDEIEDADEIDKLIAKKTDAELELSELTTKKAVNETVVNTYNEKFLKEYREKMKSEIGLEFTDDEFKIMVDRASKYGNGGKIDDNSMLHAMTDIYGAGKISAIYQMIGASKTRDDIVKAQSKATRDVNLGGGNKTAKLIRVSDIKSEAEARKLVSQMSDEELFKD